jgi:Tfp pilus assembly protein PilO
MEDILAIIFIFGGAALVGLGFSPIGRAIADRIRGRDPGGSEDLRATLARQRDEMDGELEQVRREVAELAERLDFAERLLAKTHDVERLAPPR